MSKGKTGSNTGTIISVKTKQRAAIDHSKTVRKKKKADKCKKCYYEKDGFCSRFKTWCSNASRGGCDSFKEK